MSTIILEEQAAAATPSANQVVIYPKADGLLYSKDDVGVETALGGLTAATQANQETGASLLVSVTPGRQQFHPSAAKCWALSNATLSGVSASYNLTSVTDGGTGIITFNIDVDFSSATWTPLLSAIDVVVGVRVVKIEQALGTGTCLATNRDGAGTLVDPSIGLAFAGYGDQ